MLLLVQHVSMLAVLEKAARADNKGKALQGRAGQGRVRRGRALTKELNFKARRDVACKARATSAHDTLHINKRRFEAFQQ